MHQTPTLNVQFTLSPNPEFPEKEIPSQSTSQDSFQPPDVYIEDINRGQDQPMTSSQVSERTVSQVQSSQQRSPSIQQFEPDLAKRYSFDIQDASKTKQLSSPKGNPQTKSHKSHKTVEQSLQHDIHKIERTITKNYNFYTFLVTCEFIVSAAMIVFVFYAELEQVEIILSFLHSFLMIPACFLALIAKHTYNSSKQVGVFCVFMCSTALCIATIVLAAFYLIDETYLQITTLTKCENIGDPSKDDDNYCEVFDPSLASEYHGDTLATLIAVSVQFIIGNSLVVSAWVLLRLMRKREGFIAEIKAKSKYPMCSLSLRKQQGGLHKDTL